LDSNNQKNRNIELEILTSAIEGGSYLNYFTARVRNDGTVNFALTEKPGFMKVRLHVNDGKKTNFKVLVSVTY
jgi:hypothetical protein